jgi:hypothetical protein
VPDEHYGDDATGFGSYYATIKPLENLGDSVLGFNLFPPLGPVFMIQPSINNDLIVACPVFVLRNFPMTAKLDIFE